jgi:predicted nucleic acid-binding protein
VDLIIDASSVINLHNCRTLELVTQLPGRTFWFSPLVVGECEPTCAAEILKLQQAGRAQFIDPQNIPADVFLELLDKHQLGEGETECLALCLEGPFVLCCDDHKARSIAASLLGGERVIGSLRLLKWSVQDHLIVPDAAYALYTGMKAAGGFLPVVEAAWFADGAEV